MYAVVSFPLNIPKTRRQLSNGHRKCWHTYIPPSAHSAARASAPTPPSLQRTAGCTSQSHICRERKCKSGGTFVSKCGDEGRHRHDAGHCRPRQGPPGMQCSTHTPLALIDDSHEDLVRVRHQPRTDALLQSVARNIGLRIAQCIGLDVCRQERPAVHFGAQQCVDPRRTSAAVSCDPRGARGDANAESPGP